MSDVLSQSEIDELLKALSSGVVTVEDMKDQQQQRLVKTYDFKRPDKFSKDQIRTIYMMYENFARLITTYLSVQLRAMVQVNVVSVDQLTYGEFVSSMPNPSVISVFQMNPLQGKALMEINPSIAFAMIDRLFGGPGLPPVKTRGLTDIEEVIMRRIIIKIMDHMKDAWKSFVDIEPHLERIEDNSQFTQIVTPNDIILLVTLHAEVSKAEGLINICLPYFVLETVLPKLTTSFYVTTGMTRAVTPEKVAALTKRLQSLYLPLIVRLGVSHVPVADVLNLQVGDVIPLETKIDDELDVYVDKIGKFKCRPGLYGDRVAVQITRAFRRGGEEENEE
ncbi:MAG: flagellar motor switch protein FliM [Negativicutes bacterium]|nr:flagellar motor switch protein FliM [Negativicutes bacterium]